MVNSRSIFVHINHFWTQHKIKIASTLAAIVIWFFVVTGEVFEYVIEIPIEITTLDPNYIITSPIPLKAGIHVQGTGKYLFSFLLFREGRLQLNLNWQSGEHVIYPNETDIFFYGNAKNITPKKLLWPDSIQIKIEQLKINKVPITNNVTLKPLAGYTLVGEVLVEPEEVGVRGPKSVIDTISTIQTNQLTLDELKHPVDITIDLIEPTNEYMVLLEKKVLLKADIQKLMEKTIMDVPVTVRYLPQNVNAIVIPSKLSLVIQGGVDVVFPITVKDIKAYIEYQSIKQDNSIDRPVIIEPIEGIRFRDIKPERFKVAVEIQD